MSVLDEVLELARQDKLQNGYSFFTRPGIVKEARAELSQLRAAAAERDRLQAVVDAQAAQLDQERELLESINNYLSEDHARVSGGQSYVYVKGRIGMFLSANAPEERKA